MSTLVEEATDAYERAVDALPGGEDRPGQRNMVRAVAAAFEKERHLLVEAGTGTGKSLAYLIPAISSGHKTIVATATKALQAQVTEKDLPRAAVAYEKKIAWELVKGRSNYVCLAKLNELGEILEPDLEVIAEWALDTLSGDIAELESAPPARTLALVTARSEECPGPSACSFGEECFAERARIRARSADVIVVNHHLLLADIQMRSWGASLLPEAGQVVIDEAHRLEDAAISVFGAEVFAGRFRYVSRLARGLLEDSETPDEIDELTSRAFDTLPGGRAQPIAGALRQDVNLAMNPLAERLTKLRREMDVIPTEGPAKERRIRLQKTIASLQDDLTHLLAPAEGEVAWIEGSPAGPRLALAPLDVSPNLTNGLLNEASVVMTSATLASTGGFERTARTLGVASSETAYDTLDVESPFDFEANALLYCAVHMPDPRSSDFPAAARHEINRLVEASGGSAFCLFTSWRAMTDAFESYELDYPVFCQGEAAPERLVEQFVKQSPAVLFGTQTFWQGVDVPGEALRLVVIDKIPFQPPDDPLVKARCKQIDEGGGDSFREESLPRASLLLKQGVGRLIRSVSDHGVVAVLDRRLAATAYGRSIVSVLPPMRRTKNFDEAAEFLDNSV